MNIPFLFRKPLQGLALALSVFAAPVQAAPGTLPKTPLLLTNAVEPNIFFTLDDSGSMEWEMMVADGIANASGGIPSFGGFFRYYILPLDSNGGEDPYWISAYNWWYGLNLPAHAMTAPPVSSVPDAWIARSSAINALYYDPSVTYQPWPGSDSSGNPLFVNANPSRALIDPIHPGFGAVDLTRNLSFKAYINGNTRKVSVFPAVYYAWSDSNGNGRADLADAHQRIEIRPGNAPFPSGRTYAEEIQNFANWFQYYRKRKFAAKAAVGFIVNDTDSTRMGLDAYNAGIQKQAATMTSPSNKLALLQTLYNLPINFYRGPALLYPFSSHATPGRTALKRVGDLYENKIRSIPSPILPAAQGGQCQQNFAILMSDGYWNIGNPRVGNTDLDRTGVPNNGWDGDPVESKDGGNYEDPWSDTMADVAMHFYERDLSNLADQVPVTPGVDEATHQHMVTYTIGFGLTGNIDPKTFDPLAPGFSWPDPTDREDADRIDDMLHAAYNGRGKYLSARNPAELYAAMKSAIQDIAQRTATAAAVSVNSAHLTTQSVVYLGEFNSNRWQGHLYAYPIVDTRLGTLAAKPKWEANDKLTKRDLNADPRQIITWNGSDGAPFTWSSANLTPAMMSDLSTNPDGSLSNTATAQARLAYLRGDRSNENSGYAFRSRPGLLGDLVNSGPIFVGEPNLNWPDTAPFPTASGSRYSDFKNGTAKRRGKVIYVGSNDGMLHAFDDSSGKELFAYVPGLLASTAPQEGYHYLTDPNYTHNWYVDLTPSISDVFIKTSPTGTVGWHTILIGGLRGGGRGLFALDITDPAQFSEANAANMAMWEFSSADDIDLGYTYSQPTIARANNGRWVAIFGNGYNDRGSGEAKLFILDIEKGLDGWQAGDYTVITTKAGTPTNRNGLSTPALADLDGNGTVDRVYAGDLQGNLWAFDLSGSTTRSWGVAYSTAGGNPQPLFKTRANQPITAKPVLAPHPSVPTVAAGSRGSNAPNVMVFFGTGRYLVERDKTDKTVQSFYGIWDKGIGNQVFDPNLLVQQTLVSSNPRVLTRNTVDYRSKIGWYIDLPDPGERAVTAPVARGKEIFFNTFVPVVDPCSTGGYGFKFGVDMETGGSATTTVFDYNHDGTIDGGDNVRAGVVAAIRQEGYLPKPVFIEDLAYTGAVATKVRALPSYPTGRLSWQELIK